MDPIRYTLSFPAPHTHYVEVRAEFPTGRREHVELMMAVWTPGSYLIREYARHVEGVAARGPQGQPLVVRKSAKNRWTVETAGAHAVHVTYRVYGREMSVRTNWIESSFALINGAPTFLTIADSSSRPHEITLVLPPSWRQSVTALPEVPGGLHRYCAPDYATLVDSPILAGGASLYDFDVEGTPHRLAVEGGLEVFDGERAARDLESIVRAHHRFWATVPYARYLFINLLTETGGGLEHANSTVLMTTRWATRTRKAYLGWLELASHELFHVWNGKRLRPIGLGPFDYEREVHTRALWVVEGITDYFGDLLVHRAGLSSRSEFIDSLSDKIEAVQSTPGRLVQSISDSSFDTWIKFYRPDENSPNSSISYYLKGAVVAFLLDARIRRMTDDRSSLDEVMRAAYDEYSGGTGYTEGEFRALVETTAGGSLESFWKSTLESTEELDYSEALQLLGLRFRTAVPSHADRAWLGATTRADGGRVVVSQLRRGTPAYDAGLNVEDEIVAIDGLRVRAEQLETRLEQYAPGDTARLLVARRDRLMPIDVEFGREPAKKWRLEIDPMANPRQAATRDSWLTGEAVRV